MEQFMQKQSRTFLMIKMLLVSYLTTGILLLILAFLLYKLDFGENQVNLGILITYIISCFGGGFLLGKKVENRRFLWGIGLGTGYAVLLTLVTLITEKGFQGNIKELALNYFLCILGGALGGMFS
ncbi:MAG: TIGR04086 family membrane protein [Blautia sp.]